MSSREVPRGYSDDGRRDGCNGGGRREGGPACSGRATARWAVARTRKEAPGSRGSPCLITARGRPERDTPSDGAVGAVRGRSEGDTPRDGGASATAPCLSGAAGASASTVDAAGTGASATHDAGAGDGAGAGAGASSAGLTRFLWRQRE